MALRKIYTMEHPVLRARAKKVSRFDNYLEKLVADMWETMRAAPGVGLAAPQIGESIRVLVAEFEGEHVALVNPEILKMSEEQELGTEGCLSIPGVVGEDVPRAYAVTVKARDPKGKEIRVKADGWFARILQHEIDHLDGILFIDRIPPEQVRPVQPDEMADEGEVHHEPARETVAGPSVPVKRAVEAVANGKSGKNGKGIHASPPAPAFQGRESQSNSGKNGNAASAAGAADNTPTGAAPTGSKGGRR